MYTKKQKQKNEPIQVYYGLLRMVAERTGCKRAMISRSLGGYSNSIEAHKVRNAAQEIIKELKIQK